MMLWRKKRIAQAADERFSSVQALARQLGVQRRMNARILYPRRITGPLPSVSFSGQPIQIADISVGGCCLIDPFEILGKDVGNELTLTLHFGDTQVRVLSRLVGRVEHRRHIQFLNLPQPRLESLRLVIAEAVGGAAMKQNWPSEKNGPQISVREMWSSLIGDSLALTDEVHKTAQLTLNGRTYDLHKNAWPTRAGGERVTRAKFMAMLLFLANIPHPSAGVQILLAELEALALEESR
ncbi:MAG: PilZ domain-containing protein [Bdellovibrionales bacterium]|nr:PilZ domain-containing protein [Bdellovibrionales bacterium]